MRRQVLVGGICVALAAGALVVGSSSAKKGSAGPYTFFSGVIFSDQGSVVRVSIANLTDADRKVKVIIRDASSTPVEKETIELLPGGQDNVTSGSCGFSSCPARVEVRSGSPLVAPTVRYQDTDGGVQEVLPGDLVVTRDGKRIW